MKFSAIVFLLLLTACKTNHNEVMTKIIKEQKLLNEQKLLKDNTYNLSERIWYYTSRGVYDSAEALKIQVRVIKTRLINIQSSLDSLAKAK